MPVLVVEAILADMHEGIEIGGILMGRRRSDGCQVNDMVA
jgi:hypothetical protein